MENLIEKNHFEKTLAKICGDKRILVVGDVGIDRYLFGEVDRISPEAPVPVLRVTKEETKLGMSANICHNLDSLGVPSSILSIIGKDDNALSLKNLLGNVNAKCDYLLEDKGVTTISKDRILTNVQQICRVDHEPAFFSFSPSLIDRLVDNFEKAIEQHDAIILEDYSKGVLSAESIQRLIHIAKEKNTFVAVDPGKGKPASLFKGANLLKPNFIEAKELVHSMGYESCPVEEMGEILIDKLNLDKIVITLGASGMAMWDKDSGFSKIPTVAREVFDVSGAGDTVISVITTSLVNGLSLYESCWLGNLAAGVVVSKKGTATVTKEEINILYNQINIQ